MLIMKTSIAKLLKKREKGSLTREIAMIISGMVVGTVLLCWLLNTVFLERYYVLNKQGELEEGFRVIDAASAEGMLEDPRFDVAFDNLCANGNITVLISGPDQAVVRSSVNDPKKMLIEFMDIIFGGTDETVTTLVEKELYMIERRTDMRLNAEYLVLYGTLSNGDMILMRSALESIRESVKLSNKFLFYIGIFAIAVSVLVAVFVSRRVTNPVVLMRSALESIRESVKLSNKFLFYIGIFAIAVSVLVAVFVSRRVTNPVVELTELSKRMTELDFDAKYAVRSVRQNEIDELGTHMNEMSETLEQTISELKSANNQLLIDIEKKTKIDQMRKEFLSNVSHELKTPLALIQGYAEGLRECINEDAQSRDFYCEVIMDEAEKMNLMVKKLLTLNQLESGGETVTMERFNLTELIGGVIHSSGILLEQNGITVAECPEEPLYVWADEFMVEEVITNYLSNAIHHAKDPKEIAVRYQARGDIVRVSVFNTGEAIPEEDLEKIWNKFYKVDKAHTREYGGSGIGLSIVKAVMEAFHWDCGVKNYQNGVEFWFELDKGKH